MKFKLNKALLYKDWKTTKWVAMLMSFSILFTKLFNLMNNLHFQKLYIKSYGKAYPVAWFNYTLLNGEFYFVAMATLVALLSLVLFLNEKGNSYGFLFSMPFTKKDIVKNKWFLGTSIILGSFLINALLIALFYLANLKFIDIYLNPFSDILKWFFINSTVYILIFTVFIFFQTIMGNVILSSIIAALAFWVPIFLLVIVSDLTRIFLKLSYDAKLPIPTDHIANYLCIFTYNTPSSPSNVLTQDNPLNNYVYEGFSLKLLISWILIILFLGLSLYCFSNRKLEYNNKIVCNSKLEIAFKWCVSICTGLMIGAFVGFGYFGDNLIAFSISAILTIITVYYILTRVINALT